MIHDIVPRGEMLRLEVSLRRGVPQAQPRDYRGAPYNMTQGRASYSLSCAMSDSKCARLASMFMRVVAGCMLASETMTIA